MNSFESAIDAWERRHRTPGRFKKLCGEVFQSVEGVELMALLCTVEHPLDHTPGSGDHSHGRREVIAALWRHGSSSNAIHTIPEPKQDAS